MHWRLKPTGSSPFATTRHDVSTLARPWLTMRCHQGDRGHNRSAPARATRLVHGASVAQFHGGSQTAKQSSAEGSPSLCEEYSRGLLVSKVARSPCFWTEKLTRGCPR
ncbi:hypothetical protein MRX96_000831 [Rhipicephalus microplus]